MSFDRIGRSSDGDSLLNFEATAVGVKYGAVVIATDDNVARQWAPRWLGRRGLDTRFASTAEQILAATEAEPLSLVVVDAALKDDAGQPLYRSLRSCLDATATLFVLCSSNKEVRAAADANVTDVVRRPFDWRVISQRVFLAARAQRQHQELCQARQSLSEAIASAEAAQKTYSQRRGLDRLTQLPNRRRFRSLLHTAINLPGAESRELSLLVIGIERFGIVNDAVGHHFGDELLQQFAERLKFCLQERDFVGASGRDPLTAFAGRLSGMRFGLAISQSRTDHIAQVRQAIVARMSQPFEVGGHSIHLNISIGVAAFPKDSADADALLQCAETAMLEAKKSGSGFLAHQHPIDLASARKLQLDSMLRAAVQANELQLFYQPLVETGTERIVGAEALLRWEHAIEGFISPEEFVPAAEESGLMVEIGRFVIETACRQLREWLDQGAEPIRIAINLSLCQLVRGDVVSVVERCLREFNLAPVSLEFELSERGVLNRHPEVIKKVHMLKALGVRIAIDDFGTGDASIGYLKDLPVDVIKIDRSYVSGANRTARDAAIAAGIVALAGCLQTSVVGEGVENVEQLEMLRDWGCEECQGFHFSAALPPAEFHRKYNQLELASNRERG